MASSKAVPSRADRHRLACSPDRTTEARIGVALTDLHAAWLLARCAVAALGPAGAVLEAQLQCSGTEIVLEVAAGADTRNAD